MSGPKLPDLKTLMSAGIDPKTGLPLKVGAGKGFGAGLKEGLKMILRVQDEQDAVNRYTWYNLPVGLSSQELERMLYYYGNLCFFYCKPLEKFMILPYALEGTIDVYGRFNTIHPVPIANGTTEDEKRQSQRLRDYLSTIKLKVVHDVLTEMPDEDDLTHSAVIIRDYTNQLSQTNIARASLNDPLINLMSDCLPYMRTALKNSTGVSGMRVGNDDEQSNVLAANLSLDAAALNGERYVPIQGAIDFQDLGVGQVAKSEEFLEVMQSLDNFRLSTYGLENGGLFQKKAHVLQAEQSMNAGNASFPLVDGATGRQHSCDIVNSIWALGMDCQISETSSGMDKDLNGEVGNDQFSRNMGTPAQSNNEEGGEN